jgi:hypothetical protein
VSIWKTNPDLMERLATAQNHPANILQDIMTFAAFAAFFDSREELERHTQRYEQRAAKYVAPVRRRKVRAA